MTKPMLQSPSTDPRQTTKKERASIRRGVKRQIARWINTPQPPTVRTLACLKARYSEEGAARWRKKLHSRKVKLQSIMSGHCRRTCSSCGNGDCTVRNKIRKLNSSIRKGTNKIVMFEALEEYDTLEVSIVNNTSSLIPQDESAASEVIEPRDDNPRKAAAPTPLVIRESQPVSASNGQSSGGSIRDDTHPERSSQSMSTCKAAAGESSRVEDVRGSASRLRNDVVSRQAAKFSTQTKKPMIFFTATELDSDSASTSGSEAVPGMSGGNNLERGSHITNDLTVRVPGRVRGTEARLCNKDAPTVPRRFTNTLPESDEFNAHMRTSRNTRTLANDMTSTSKSKPERRSSNAHRCFTMSGALPAHPPPGASADVAIKVESDDDDTFDHISVRAPNSVLPSTRGSGVNTSYSLLSKDELLLLVGKKDAERANASHRAKVREYLCKYQGISDTMIEAFETKLSNKGTWESAAKKIIGTDRKRLLDAPPNWQRRATTQNSD